VLRFFSFSSERDVTVITTHTHKTKKQKKKRFFFFVTRTKTRDVTSSKDGEVVGLSHERCFAASLQQHQQEKHAKEPQAGVPKEQAEAVGCPSELWFP
jgi:hypothetical protein